MKLLQKYEYSSHDVTCATFVSQTSPVGVELFSNASHVSENALLNFLRCHGYDRCSTNVGTFHPLTQDPGDQ